MKRINNGVELARQSWAALRANPQLMVFPLISGIGVILVTIIFAIPTVALDIFSSFTGNEGGGSQAVGFVLAFLYYFVLYTIIIFSNTALVGAAMRLAQGKEATVSDGIAIARKRISKILFYALISATVGMVARALRDSGRDSNNPVMAIVAAIVASIIQGAWNLVVFFAIPIIVAEDTSVIESLKRSLQLFKQTWGESFVGSTAISIVGCLAQFVIFLVGGVIIALAASTGSIALIIGAVLLVVLVFAGVLLLNGAINGIFQASLYQYAMTGDAGRLIDTQLAANAFQEA